VHADASFRDTLPRQVRAPAVFKCVRVTSIDDGEDEYAYQATVTINGHVFKGFLYDQGVDDGRHASTSNDDSTAAGVPNMSELHLGGASASGPGSGGVVREGGSSMLPTELYGGGQNLIGGSGYGNAMN
jgi:LRP1 type putative zinc finger protein